MFILLATIPHDEFETPKYLFIVRVISYDNVNVIEIKSFFQILLFYVDFL